MIHRVVFGSIERFIGILIEHYAGKFPLWLAPVQVKVLPISDKFAEYGASVMAELQKQGIRCEIDNRDEKIGYKIREAQLGKVPYMIVVGQKEVDNKLVTIRRRDENAQESYSIQELMQLLKNEIQGGTV